MTGTAALLLIGYAIGALADPGTRPLAWLLLAAGVILLAAFVRIEAAAAEPLTPLRLFLVREVTGSAIVNALVGAAHVPAFALLSLYLQKASTSPRSPPASRSFLWPAAWPCRRLPWPGSPPPRPWPYSAASSPSPCSADAPRQPYARNRSPPPNDGMTPAERGGTVHRIRDGARRP
ncbi:hypothetical protein [Microtetraspora sp. NBRC 16547]|uniref:hypothetical protein n=1 Tax=Microtetraspora sp. NBRC 16547 TaxID=3030993 RepID=UPI00255467D8|nr:hypothetical protein [Microtetraspora sp. NBRC 16547]